MCAQGNLSSVIEYVHGGSLKAGLQKLQRDINATERFRAAVALQAARGKEATHGHAEFVRSHLLICTMKYMLLHENILSYVHLCPHRPLSRLAMPYKQDLALCCESS